jgi:hypothetical protein
MDNTIKQSIIIGSLLGDGCIERNKKCGSMNYSEQHTEKQRDYLEWKRKYICSDKRMEEINRSFGKVYRIRWSDVETIRHLREEWYPNGKKIVPKSLMNDLDELALMVWYFDDGDHIKSKQPMKHFEGNWKRNALRISTASFTYKENLYLRRILHRRFGIQPTLVKEKCACGKYYRLYFGKAGDAYNKIIEIIENCFYKYKLPDCLKYKLRERVESRQGKTPLAVSGRKQNSLTGKFVSLRCAPPKDIILK